MNPHKRYAFSRVVFKGVRKSQGGDHIVPAQGLSYNAMPQPVHPGQNPGSEREFPCGGCSCIEGVSDSGRLCSTG